MEAERFVVSTAERETAALRKPVVGPLAVRVPKLAAGVSHFHPAALITQPDLQVRAYLLHEAREPDRLVCSIEPVDDERFRVLTPERRELGQVYRTPQAKRAIQHAWCVRQPGHPAVVARYHWAKGSPKDILERGKDAARRETGRLADSVLDSVMSLGLAEGGDQHNPQRAAKPVTWRADDEVVLEARVSGGEWTYTPKAPWLDHRLAYAMALLRRRKT